MTEPGSDPRTESDADDADDAGTAPDETGGTDAGAAAERPEERRDAPGPVWKARLPRGRQLVVTMVALLVAATAAVLLVDPDPSLPWADDDDLVGVAPDFAAYCRQVQDQQQPLSQALSADSATGLIAALPSFEALRDDAPDDIADDWSIVVARVSDLVDALDAAGVDPATYDPDDPPEGVGADEQRAIRAAAERLVAPPTVQALEAVQQQARDVCRTPLTT